MQMVFRLFLPLGVGRLICVRAFVKLSREGGSDKNEDISQSSCILFYAFYKFHLAKTFSFHHFNAAFGYILRILSMWEGPDVATTWMDAVRYFLLAPASLIYSCVRHPDGMQLPLSLFTFIKLPFIFWNRLLCCLFFMFYLPHKNFRSEFEEKKLSVCEHSFKTIDMRWRCPTKKQIEQTYGKELSFIPLSSGINLRNPFSLCVYV